MLKNLKLRVKILLILVFISLTTAGLVGIIVFTLGNKTLKAESFNKLTAIREMKANQIENYFQQIFNQALSFSESRTVVEATLDFKKGFDNIQAELNYSGEQMRMVDSTLFSYYQSHFIEPLINRDSSLNYFSIPKEELIESLELWLKITQTDTTVAGYDGQFPHLDPSDFSGSIKMSGSSTVSSLVERIIKQFNEEGAKGSISYEKTGTSEGIRNLTVDAEADIIGSSHKLSIDEIEIFKNNGLVPVSFRIGTDALAVVTSDKNDFLDNLSSDELKKAFTTAKKWSDINPDWPDQNISRFLPDKGSGSYNRFSEVILGGDYQLLSNQLNSTFIKDGTALKEAMSANPNTIAFYSYSYFKEDSYQKLVQIDGVNLSNTNIRNEKYPLTRPLYLVTTESKLKYSTQVGAFTNFVLNSVVFELGANLQKIEYWPQHQNHRILQYQYLVNNPYQQGEKDRFIEHKDQSSYNSAHRLYHPIFKNYLDRFGFYDIFLIDADSGHVIYSVSKEVDFATDLLHGPFNSTNISDVFRRVVSSDDPHSIYLEDFSPYLPSYNAPASFIASPIYNGDERIGVLVFQLPIDRINHIMTDGYNWEQVGLGKSGETYLVGDDYLLRTQSRFLVENPSRYFQQLKQANISTEIISKISALNSSIGLQPVSTEGTLAALQGKTGTEIFSDYRDVEVLSSFKPLKIEQVNWVIMSEIDKSEAFAAIPLMFQKFLIWFAVLLVVVLMLSIIFARSISKPVQILTQRASDLARGNLDDSVKIDQKDEIGLLADHFEKMRSSIKKLIVDLKDINQNLENKVIQRTAELNEAKEAADDILDKSPVPVAVIDVASTSFIRVNDSMCEFNKLSPEELIRKSALDIYFDRIRDQQAVVDQLREFGGVENLEIHLKRIGTGEERWGLVSMHPITYYNQQVYITTIIDITERKEMVERLLIQSAAMESTANGIVITSTDGTIQWINPAFSKLTGYTFDEAKGQNPRIIKSGKHDEAFFKRLWDTILSGKTWHGEIINKNKDGELYTEDQTITPVVNDKKQITSFVGIKQDITERKKMEAIVLKAKKRMEDELNVAKDIQMSMLPLIFPAYPKRIEIDIHADLIPAREVGGDFYDFYFLDENHICFVVGDVSGKGVPGALLMAVTKTLLKSRASNDKSTASILTHVNNEIARENDAYMFITVFIAILDTNTGELVFSNAGHNPSFILNSKAGVINKLSELHGPVIGAMEDMTYTESNTHIKKGDIILAYTDGITEAQNKNEELFSDARFSDLLNKAEYNSPKALIEMIIKDVKAFEDGAEQFDDITALAVQYCQNPNTISSDNISVEIINKLEEINTVVEQFESFGIKNNIQVPIIHKFNIAFDELLSNIISYGYKDDIEHKIQVDAELVGERLIVIITDDGIPFNPFKKDPPDTKLTVEERSIGGLGIHLVKNLMDEYNYKRNIDTNIITLIRHNINT